MEEAQEIIRGIESGLLQWYGFRPGCAILYIGEEGDALAELLKGLSGRFVCASCEEVCEKAFLGGKKEGFDYIVCVAALERQKDPGRTLRALRGLLQAEGKLLLGMNNRFGIKYFCGDRDPYTERNFDGVEGYRRAYAKKEDVFRGRMYSRAELEGLLLGAGFETYRFYSVLTDLKHPTLIYAEDFLPNEDLACRVFPTYHYPGSVFLEEESLYADLAANGMFHRMANAYLIECAPDGDFSDVCHVTCSTERGREDAFFTVIHASGVVEKRAANPEGKERLLKLLSHGAALSARGVSVVPARMENGAYVMPYIRGEVGQVYLKRLFYEDPEAFLEKLDLFRDLILQSSEIVKPDMGDGEGALLRRAYPDMVPLNSFYVDGTFVFYDQEFCEENYPANAVISRMIATLYAGDVELQKRLPMERLYERYGMAGTREKFLQMEWAFLAKLRNEKTLRAYHNACRRNGGALHANRQRMNYSQEEYERLFVNIFQNADTRKLVLFGAGNFTKKFFALYGQDYPAYAVVDNRKEKWGQSLCGVEILSPQMLTQMSPGEYKVLICIKNYVSVMKQLDGMGVTEYSIFDADRDYPRKRRPISPKAEGMDGGTGKKKYHVGYIAGVFDLFHIGHLNLLARAKERCDYLIVGVVTDEGVRKYKGVEPFVPYAERAALVGACRYVDEVAKIPLDFGGTRDAWKLHHFDCQFSGSDYSGNADWLSEKAFLEKHGAQMEFFPYTQGTSSTKIKALIDKKLT